MRMPGNSTRNRLCIDLPINSTPLALLLYSPPPICTSYATILHTKHQWHIGEHASGLQSVASPHKRLQEIKGTNIPFYPQYSYSHSFHVTQQVSGARIFQRHHTPTSRTTLPSNGAEYSLLESKGNNVTGSNSVARATSSNSVARATSSICT